MVQPQNRDLMAPERGGDSLTNDLLPRRKIVVVIGIDQYAHLPKLRCAVSDAMGVQSLLLSRFGFEAPIPALTNQAANKGAIESLVEDRLRNVLKPDDALLLFFAGHGTTRVDRLGDVTVETGYLAPIEARGADVFGDLINMEELLRKIGRLPARHILVMLDACHSGMALGSAMSQYRSMDSFVHRLVRNMSRRVITSARRDEPALDSGPIPGHSLFTGAFIQGLTSGAADLDKNGIITFSELALCLQQWVGQASGSRQTPDYGAFHHDDRGELVLAASPGALEKLSLEAQKAPRSFEPQRERSIGKGSRRIRLLIASCVAIAGLIVLLLLGARTDAGRSAVEAVRCLSASSCLEIGEAYEAGKGIPKDAAHAARAYRKACDGGAAAGCTHLGDAYAAGLGVAPDLTAAADLYHKGCDGGDPMGCNHFGHALTYGKGVPKDYDRAAQLFRKGCDGGYAIACGFLGDAYRNGNGVGKDATRAADLLKKGCDGGNQSSCLHLADMYYKGDGVAKDYTRSNDIYRKCCDSKIYSGCVYLGISYEFGDGVGRDYGAAAQLYRTSCDNGESFGCHKLGFLNATGQGVPANLERAAELQRKACDGGLGDGCTELGYAHENGKGVPRDIARAAELYRKGCDAGSGVGCSNLGLLYSKGSGVPKDMQRAKEFYRKACDNGYNRGCDLWASAPK
jgi:uncharacterized protein